MHIHLSPGTVHGSLRAPSSKSYSHRAVIVACLATGTSIIDHVLCSDDVLHTIAACKALGAGIKIYKTQVTISGIGGKPTPPARHRPITCGASGTTARLILAVAACCPEWVMIDGDGRLRERPMKPLIDALISQGAQAEYGHTEGLLPVNIRSDGLYGGTIHLDASVSSQYVSALLLVSPYAQHDTDIHAHNPKSSPYIDITIDVMKAFGVSTSKKDTTYHVSHETQYTSTRYTVEGDYSSASYALAAAAVTGSMLTVTGLSPTSVQGDRRILDILTMMGCDIAHTHDAVTIKGNPLKGIDIDMSDIPDIVPTICAIAPSASTPTTIRNIAHLRQKETDRIHAIVTELSKMRATISCTEDTIRIEPSTLQGTAVDTYDDHRMAMSFSVAALSAKNPTIIKDADVISKSYPDFWHDMKNIGMNYSVLT